MEPFINLHVRCLTDDHFNYSRIFVENCYGLKRQNEPFVAVDINAGPGYFTHIAALCGAKKVYALEPNVENFYILCKNTELLGKSISQLPFGISNLGPVIPMYGPDKVNNFKLYSSIRLDPDTPEERPTGHGTFLHPNQLCLTVLESEPEIDLLKIFLPFYEDILSAELLNKTKNICIELLGIESSTLEGVKQKLVAAGFKDVIVKNSNYDKDYEAQNPNSKFNFILIASKDSCEKFFITTETK